MRLSYRTVWFLLKLEVVLGVLNRSDILPLGQSFFGPQSSFYGLLLMGAGGAQVMPVKKRRQLPK